MWLQHSLRRYEVYDRRGSVFVVFVVVVVLVDLRWTPDRLDGTAPCRRTECIPSYWFLADAPYRRDAGTKTLLWCMTPSYTELAIWCLRSAGSSSSQIRQPRFQHPWIGPATVLLLFSPHRICMKCELLWSSGSRPGCAKAAERIEVLCKWRLFVASRTLY